MRVYRLKTPLSSSDVQALRCGDVVYLSGTIVTARDSAHKRISEELKRGGELPVDVRGLPIYHAGPVVKAEDGNWRIIAIGPTTSYRVSRYVEDVCRAGVKMIIGKGGLSQECVEVLRKYKCAYCSFTGGVAVTAAKSVKRVLGVEWLDLGIPEAMWILEVEELGPLLVTMDSHGADLYSEVESRAKRLMEGALIMFS